MRATASPGYEQVKTGKTGHSESVRIAFNPEKLSYEELLEKWFFRMHDPTTKNRQGNDVGTPVSLSNLLPNAGTETRRTGREGSSGRQRQMAREDSDGDHTSERLHSCRGIPPKSTCRRTQAAIPATTCANDSKSGGELLDSQQ